MDLPGGDAVVGFCRTGPADQDQNPDLGSRAAEVYGLYIEPERIGTGLGRQLFRHAAADLDGRGYGPCACTRTFPTLRQYVSTNDRVSDLMARLAPLKRAGSNSSKHGW
ncbi:GNAT family N-acetyltransferase [Streptomyces sp. NPDC052042]|uniref:GNAT family N-acetyltransferase n=1 Tax=Streptomyces sp. NPDC052042 TaxID=3365683 RepID=UPI0037D71C70